MYRGKNIQLWQLARKKLDKYGINSSNVEGLTGKNVEQKNYIKLILFVISIDLVDFSGNI